MRFLITVCLVLAIPLIVYAQEPTSIREQIALDRTVFESRNLTEAQAAELEKALEKEPDSITVRAQLLGFYSAHRTFTDQDRNWRAQALWWIRNHPENPIAGNRTIFGDRESAAAEGRQLWFEQIEKRRELAVLQNAAHWFTNREPDAAERILRQGEQLAPTDPYWEQALGNLYMLGARGTAKVESAAKAVAAFERSLALQQSSIPFGRDRLISNLAEAAYAAEDWGKAEQYADLASLTNNGDAQHYGHWVLGELALRADHIDEAKTQLLASGNVESTAVLSSFGPRMRLAAELLKRGERDVVLKYFEECATFWKSGADKLTEWTASVKAGKTPNFGFNGR